MTAPHAAMHSAWVPRAVMHHREHLLYIAVREVLVNEVDSCAGAGGGAGGMPGGMPGGAPGGGASGGGPTVEEVD